MSTTSLATKTRQLKPNTTSWIFAVTSLFLTIVAAGLVLVLGFFLEQHSALDQLIKAIREVRIDRVRELFPILESATERGEYVVEAISGDLSLEDRENVRRTTFMAGFELDLSKRSEVEKGLAAVRALSQFGLPSEAIQRLEKIKEALATMNSKQSIVQEDQRLNSERELQQQKLIKNHALIGEDFAELLTLPSLYSYQKQGKLIAYQEGVLKDLPMLEKLEDNIPALADLRVALRDAGGAVHVNSDDVAQAFSEKLSSIKAASTAVVEEYNTLEDAREASEDKIFSSQQENLKAQTTLRLEIGGLLDILSAIDI